MRCCVFFILLTTLFWGSALGKQRGRCGDRHSAAERCSEDSENEFYNNNLAGALLQTVGHRHNLTKSVYANGTTVQRIGKKVPAAQLLAQASVFHIASELRNFIHRTALALLLITFALAYFARPQIPPQTTTILGTRREIPPTFRKHQYKYLIAWALAVAADWMQGPYVYALYASFGYGKREINHFFVVGFASSMVFGTFVGIFADTWGRKRVSLMYCALYIVDCAAKHCDSYWCLMFANSMGGIANSILFSTFECWMLSEHKIRHQFSESLLRYMFSAMYFVNYIVAISVGIVAQIFVDAFPMQRVNDTQSLHFGGNLCPAEITIVILSIAFLLICFTWHENYGESGSQNATAVVATPRGVAVWRRQSTKHCATPDSCRIAIRAFCSSWKMACIGIIVAGFEGGMYTFVVDWTPALELVGAPLPPHGIIFSTMMMCCMLGSSIFSLMFSDKSPAVLVLIACVCAFMSFTAVTIVVGQTNFVNLVFICFLYFQFCVGLYMPSCSALKSSTVPEEFRSGIYTLYRVPMNIIVCIVVLSNLPIQEAFGASALLLGMSGIACMIFCRSDPLS